MRALDKCDLPPWLTVNEGMGNLFKQSQLRWHYIRYEYFHYEALEVVMIKKHLDLK